MVTTAREVPASAPARDDRSNNAFAYDARNLLRRGLDRPWPAGGRQI